MDEEKREGAEEKELQKEEVTAGETPAPAPSGAGPAEEKPVEQPAPLDEARGEQEEPKQEEKAEEAPVEEKPLDEARGEEEKVEEVVPEVTKEAKPEEKAEEAPAEEPAVEEKVEEPKAEEPAKPVAQGKWYVIQALTGKEDMVKQAIEQTIELKGIKNKVFQVLVPTEEIIEIKGGKRLVKVKKMFPGYVFLEMILDEESWYLIRETAGVARFIGTKVRPTPVSEKEMQRVLKQLGREERLEITFEKGEGVRIISGPFRGYTGTVDEVSPEKGKLKVLINIFGRDTPVEVNFEHAQKIV